jgi:GNAT superfamily N-acetyltransferase
MLQSAKLQSYFREYARSNTEARSVPPFTLFLHAADKSERANFAMPDHSVSGDVSHALRQIESTCVALGCKAHIRFLRAFAPELPAALQASGYVEAESWSIMLCTPESLQLPEPVAGLEMVTVSSESSLELVKEGWDTNALGYDMAAELATDEVTEEFRQSLKECLAFTARLHGQAVGAGMYNPIRNGITELVGVTTLAAFRRRGIASFLSAFATQTAFTHGAEMVLLSPENPEASRVYERIGYRFYSDHLIYQTKVAS